MLSGSSVVASTLRVLGGYEAAADVEALLSVTKLYDEKEAKPANPPPAKRIKKAE